MYFQVNQCALHIADRDQNSAFVFIERKKEPWNIAPNVDEQHPNEVIKSYLGYNQEMDLPSDNYCTNAHSSP